MFLFQCFCDGDASSNNDDKSIFQILDKEFDSLTPEGKQRVHDEIYGVEKINDETDSFIEEKLVELGKEISLLSDEITKPYMQAIEMEKEEERIAKEKASNCRNQGDNIDRSTMSTSQMDTHHTPENNHDENNTINDDETKNEEPPYMYVRSAKFRLMFLRADKFDAKLAARRITRFFHVKLSLFDKSKLCHRIKINDLGNEDLNALYAGGLCTTGITDGSGRLVFLGRRKGYMNHKILNIKRACFYLLVSHIEMSIKSQKKGVVVIAQNRSFNNYEVGYNAKPFQSSKLFPLLRIWYRAFPVRTVAVHVLYDNAFDNIATKCLLGVFPKNILPSTIPHYILDDDECKEVMMDYGIDVDSLPLAKGGDFDTEKIQQYLEERSIKE